VRVTRAEASSVRKDGEAALFWGVTEFEVGFLSFAADGFDEGHRSGNTEHEHHH
jgi:hypothetical protein